MIVTVTANPMLEHFFPLQEVRPGRPHHPSSGAAYATGKGLNVARGLHDLGDEVTAVVAVGGERGEQVRRRVQAEGIPARFVEVDGESRIGFVAHHRGRTTSFYGPGPRLSDDEVDALVDAVAELLPVRFVVLAGSVSHPDLYPRLCDLEARVVLDFNHQSLERCVETGDVLLVKPNRDECRALLGEANPVRAAERLARLGPEWVIVTDGAAPAIVRHGDETWWVHPPHIEAVHPVGCGDSVCAGLLHAIDRDPREAVSFAIACGAHNAARPEVGRLDLDDCERLAKQIAPATMAT